MGEHFGRVLLGDMQKKKEEEGKERKEKKNTLSKYFF